MSRAKQSHQALKDKDEWKEGSQAISQKDEHNSNQKAQEEHSRIANGHRYEMMREVVRATKNKLICIALQRR